MFMYSRGVNLSSLGGTGLQASCAGDASQGAPASREQQGPLRECAPVRKKDVDSIIMWVWWTSTLPCHELQSGGRPAPASDPSDVWSSLYLLGDCWCSLCQRRPVVEEGESRDEDLLHHRFIISDCSSPSLLPCNSTVPPDIWRCPRSQQHLWPHWGTCWAGWCCHDAACVGTGWWESAAPGSYSPPRKWHSPEGSPPPGNKYTCSPKAKTA